MQAVPAKRGRARFARGGRPGLNLSAQCEGGKKTIQYTVGVIAERSHGLIVQHRLSPVSGFEQPRSGVRLGRYPPPWNLRRACHRAALCANPLARNDVLEPLFRPPIHGNIGNSPLLLAATSDGEIRGNSQEFANCNIAVRDPRRQTRTSQIASADNYTKIVTTHK
jgi:hypothetical protein